MDTNHTKIRLDDIKVDIELAKLRKTRAWLARELGLTRQLFWYYHRTGSLKYLPKIAKILGVPENDLLSVG